jgi:DNA-binding transcriptional MerR regulator
MAKSSDAFRTIGEVSDELDVPKHVLRFWEGKFPQLKPMKRGGGRRFYRPEDVALLRGIHHLLHSAGYTIKGVQRILREQGVDAVKFAENGGAPPTGTAETVPAQKKPTKRGAGPALAKRPPLPSALRSELEALASELDAVLALARGEGTRAVAAARGGATKAKRG